jgi:thiopeptide-type bacteriocin biosynthesis protein
VAYEDDTAFGSMVSGRFEDFMRRCSSRLAAHRQAHGLAAIVRDTDRWLEDLFSGDLSPLFAGRETLREDCLFPAAEGVRPAALEVTQDDSLLARIPLSNPTELAPWIGEFSNGASKPLSGPGRSLFEALEACGALSSTREPASLPEADATFVGHATVALNGGIAFDPFFRPRSDRYPASYQPLSPRDLGEARAVFITHSHSDHFDVGSLLRLGRDVPIYVPEVARESLLSIDMARRLEELGFSNVRRTRPGAEARFGETRVTSLPFFGEQPTDADVHHPDVRNIGCTYLADVDGKRFLVLADSGVDREGDIREVAAQTRRSHGRVDVVFGGYRAFALYPIHYLFTSVARYLLFVPRTAWGVRQKSMNDADALLDTAERAGARHVVPYADGGAPWYWEVGLGPRLDGHLTPNPAFDPPPEDVAHLAARRSSWHGGSIGSPVNVVVLRPGETISADGKVGRGPEQRWPYGTWLQANVALKREDGSALPSARAVFDALTPVMSRLRAVGSLSRFFFMRKPPDLRLRWFGSGPLVEAEIRRCLDGLMARGVIERWFPSVYEPETERFGGDAAMEAVHDWFDTDTMQWMALATSGVVSEREALCAFVAKDLLERAVDDPAEAHGVWRHYIASMSCERPSGSLDLPSIPPDRIDALDAYRSANARLAGRLRDVWARGDLTVGLRAVLAAVILFHFHRYGLRPEDHARIAWAMIESSSEE